MNKATPLIEKLMKITTLFLAVLCLSVPVIPVNAQTNMVFTAPSGSPMGLISERVLKEAYGNIGISIRVDKVPGKRALASSNSGQVDGEANRIANINEKFSNLIMIPVPVVNIKMVAFSKQETFPINGWESLKPYYIGIRRGIRISEEGTKGMRRQLVDDYRTLFTLLDLGRVEVVVTPHLVGLIEMKKSNIKDVKTLEPPLIETKLYHYLHKKHESLVPKITASLRKMEADGDIERIQDQVTMELR
ncbi:MAG: transporter substrate-binding domain-containing protein [Sedimenticola sp.]